MSPPNMRYVELVASLQSQGPGAAYLLCGPETLLRDQALDELGKRLREDAGGSIDHDRFHGGEGPLSAVTSAFTTTGLFSTRRMVTVTLAEKWGKAGKRDRDELFSVLAGAASGSCFVAMSDLTPREFERKNEFCKGLAKVCQVVELWHPRPADAMRWLFSECQRRELGLQADAGELLLAKIGPDLQELSRELEKLALWAEPGSKIDAEQLRALIREGQVGTGWQFVDAASAGDAMEALRNWDAVRGSETVPRLLWLLQQRSRADLATGRSRGVAGGLALRSYALERAIKTGALPAAAERLAVEGLVVSSVEVRDRSGRAPRRGPRTRDRG